MQCWLREYHVFCVEKCFEFNSIITVQICFRRSDKALSGRLFQLGEERVFKKNVKGKIKVYLQYKKGNKCNYW